MGNIEEAERHIRFALEALGFDLDQEDQKKTPKRVAKYWEEMIGENAPSFFWTQFDKKGTSQMIAVREIDFSSGCAHHLLPFYGKAHIAYIPNENIVGLSKLPRVVKHYSKNFTTQEYLTNSIAEAIKKRLDTKDVAVVMVAAHTCMSCRGAESLNAETITSSIHGAFIEEPETRKEFFDFIKL